MPQTIIVVPTHHGVGTTSVCLGLLRACQRTSINTAFLKPIAQPGPTSNERSAELAGRFKASH
jgi:phosphate acetyltransferase